LLIADPWFYAVALPAALLVGVGKSGVGGGMGMLSVALMAQTISVPQAAAIALPLLTVGDAYGLAALWRQRDRAALRVLMPAGLLGIVAGTLLFGALSGKKVALILGLVTLAFLAVRTVFPPRADAALPSRVLGWAMGAVSGLTSFLAHAGGPPLAFYLLPKRLPPATYAATGAVFLAAMNASKWIPYAWLGLIDLTNMATAVLLAPVAVAGVWIGLKLLRAISALWFYRLVSIGLLATGIKLVWDGMG
jgi:uncharacterized membrane protein YfcA